MHQPCLRLESVPRLKWKKKEMEHEMRKKEIGKVRTPRQRFDRIHAHAETENIAADTQKASE
jgi:hypothetical protein